MEIRKIDRTFEASTAGVQIHSEVTVQNTKRDSRGHVLCTTPLYNRTILYNQTNYLIQSFMKKSIPSQCGATAEHMTRVERSQVRNSLGPSGF